MVLTKRWFCSAIFMLQLLSATLCVNSTPINTENPLYPSELKQKDLEEALATFTIKFGKLLRNASDTEDNIVFSPFTLYSALLLLHLGSAGSTQDEISTALQIPTLKSLGFLQKFTLGSLRENVTEIQTPEQQFHQHFSNILKKIQHTNSASVLLENSNGIFSQSNFSIKEEYAQSVKSLYNARITDVDFQAGGMEPVETINKWISEKTKARIPKLFKEPLPIRAGFLLVSSLYFSGNWKCEFWPINTKLEQFNSGRPTQSNVRMMSHQQALPYLNNTILRYEMISLPYAGSLFSLRIILPYNDQSLASLANQLSPKDLLQILQQKRATHRVRYKIPRMKLATEKDVNTHLMKLGIETAFANADLSNMTSCAELHLDRVTHATEIEVDENGTAASSVSASEVVIKGAFDFEEDNLPFVEFHVSRSFMFFISHEETNVVLFSGIVNKP